jgi:hypothetical protein
MKLDKGTARNLFICFGVYYISSWVAYPLDFVYWKLTDRIIYRGELAGMVGMPLVRTAVHALVAFGAGATVALLVDSERPLRWATFLAVLYIFFGTLGYHWARQPSFLDRLAQLIGPVFMGISCLGGAMLALQRLAHSQRNANSR